MTSSNPLSRLHHITLPLESHVGSSINTYKTQLRNINFLSHETTNPLIVTVDWLVEEEKLARQLQQLERGEINIVFLNCLDFDEIVHIQNIRVRERGGFVDQWTVQGEFNLVGDLWRWIIDAEEITTDWDKIIDIEPVDSDDPPTGITEVSGTWVTTADAGRDGTGDYSWRCTASGYCTIGNLWLADMDVSLYFDVSTTDNDVIMYVRIQDSNTYYMLTVNCGTSSINFRHTDPGDTIIGTWNLPVTITADTYYKVRVVARGDRFDIFFNEGYIGTKFDDRIIAGRSGFRGTVSSGTIDFDDITVKHTKSIAITFPVGMYDLNQVRMPTTNRLDDDEILGQTVRTVVAPINPVEFRQVNLDGDGLNVSGGNDVIVWDTMNEASEANWEQVFDTSHPFTGDVVVSNGKIRLFQDINNGYNYNNRMKIQSYSDVGWIDPVIDIKFSEVTTYGSPMIKSQKKYEVVLMVKATTSTKEIHYEIYVTQASFAMIKVTDWFGFDADISVIAATRSDTTLSQTYSISPQFCLVSLDLPYDADVDDGAAGIGSETEGLSLFFSTQKNVVGMFFSEDNTDWRCLADSGEPIKEIYNVSAIDWNDDVDHWWGIGFMPFTTSLLNSTGWDDSVLTGVEAGFITINNYPAGGYRAYVHATGASGDEDATYIITGAKATSGTNTITDIPTGGAYYYVDFIADALDSITYTITRVGGTGSITLGDLIIVPIGNRKNFPLDLRNQALQKVVITELGGKL